MHHPTSVVVFARKDTFDSTWSSKSCLVNHLLETTTSYKFSNGAENSIIAWKSPRWIKTLLNSSGLFQTTWKNFIAAPPSTVICVNFMFDADASFCDCFIHSMTVLYWVIGCKIGGRKVIIVIFECSLPNACITQPTKRGMDWGDELKTLLIIFHSKTIFSGSNFSISILSSCT